jgi:hypothetical protein
MVFLISVLHVTSPTHIIILELTTLIIILGEEYDLLCSLYSFLQPHAAPSLLGQAFKFPGKTEREGIVN